MQPRIVFAGTPEFAQASLDALARWCEDGNGELVAVYSRADKPAGRGRRLTASPVKQRALALGVPVEQPASLKGAEAQERLAAYRPDLLVVAAYGLILPEAVLDTPRLGCVNVHASLLPRWRGAAPIHRAILAGDAETGITIMQMDAGLDTGAMWLKRAVAITPDDTGGSLHDRLALLGGEALVEALPAIVSGTGKPKPQDGALATYAAKLDKREATIDWRQSAAQIERQVRAFCPWPVAQSTLDGGQLRIWSAVAVRSTVTGMPGRVIATHDDAFDVACGEGSLRIDRVQVAGKRAVPVADFLNAHDVRNKILGSAPEPSAEPSK